ncbi:hypothetical protein AGMMS49573_01750 [Endomicrobiia bacterium]|nr:hypothetical protein AGMMS49573_01750 [Endomicrobiia bacterium]
MRAEEKDVRRSAHKTVLCGQKTRKTYQEVCSRKTVPEKSSLLRILSDCISKRILTKYLKMG